MKPLTLDRAMELYEILGIHIPDVDDDSIDVTKFIGKIISNIKESGEHQNYVDSVMLMSDKEWEEVKTLEPEKVLNLFVEGLVVNKVVHLKSFCTRIGFSYA